MPLRFVTGREIAIDGQVLRLVDKIRVGGEEAWLAKRLKDGSAQTHSVAQMEELYVAGRLVAHDDEGVGTPFQRATRARDRRTPRDVLRPAARERRDFRRSFLRLVQSRLPPGAAHAKLPAMDGTAPMTLLQKVLADASRELGRAKPVSPATYYRWKELAPEGSGSRALDGDFSLRGARHEAQGLVKQAALGEMQRLFDEAANRRRTDRPPEVTMAAIRQATRARLDVLRMLHPGLAGKIKDPCHASYHNWIKEIPAVTRAVAQHGQVRTRQMFRFVRGHDRPEAAFDKVEYDETKLPFFFFDEDHAIPLGRATLCWFLDVYSHGVCGFYLGFEPASDLTMTSAMRHCCLPKTYVRHDYPGIENEWLMRGIPRRVVVDNSKPAWGRTAEALAHELDMDWDFTPVRQPYLKPIVEGMFKILNTDLLREIPGFVLSRDIDAQDYDPAVNGCLGIRHFLYILHKWLLDLYHSRRQAWLGCSPNERYLEGTRNVEPGLIDRASDLEALFGIVRKGRLDHRGIVYEGIRYRSDELQALRLRDGAVQAVDVKVNPSDLHRVHVLDRRERIWVPATAERPSYAAGMSLHRHALIRKFAANKYNRRDEDILAQAQQDLSQLIRASYKDALSIQASALTARALGVGTQNILGGIDHDGLLQAPTGPFAGKAANPWQAPAGRGGQTAPLQPQSADTATCTSRRRLQPNGTAQPGPEPSRRRVRPKLQADLSLRCVNGGQSSRDAGEDG